MAEDNCIFCKIARGVIPSTTVYEDEDFRVILDLGPASKGHSLILPKGKILRCTTGHTCHIQNNMKQHRQYCHNSCHHISRTAVYHSVAFTFYII